MQPKRERKKKQIVVTIRTKSNQLLLYRAAERVESATRTPKPFFVYFFFWLGWVGVKKAKPTRASGSARVDVPDSGAKKTELALFYIFLFNNIYIYIIFFLSLFKSGWWLAQGQEQLLKPGGSIC